MSAALAVTLLGTLVILIYVVAAPIPGEKFTEFGILGTAGEMADYPRELGAGEAGEVVLDITNHEYREVTYRIEIRDSGAFIKELGPVTLQDLQTWRQKVDFTPLSAGENRMVEFLLFKEGESEPYRSLHLWINVGESN